MIEVSTLMENSAVETNDEYGILSRIFRSRAVAQILDFFLDHKEFDYSANEIARKTGLSFRTIFRELPDLEERQLIFNTRRIGKVNMYKLNLDLDAVASLEKFSLELSQISNRATSAIRSRLSEREDELVDDEIDSFSDRMVHQTKH
jgi:DNA-binding transcriptional regulator YhcF (GntR family)